ncbi:MAG: hypothetical protein AMS21_07360 [Gemmatimonas sp. SG8_38_2]|nr:MAG: hypothetical protein AMS21_07360 [Gemmatimonas sp. SG8_38_2]
MRRLVITAASLAVLTSACQPARTEMTERQRFAIADTVQQSLTRLQTAYDALDPESFLSFYSDDMRWGANGIYQIRADFDAGVRRYMATLDEAVNVCDEVVVRVLGPDAAVVEAMCHETEVFTSGDTLEDTYAMTLVWARVEAEWKVVNAHSSHPRPAA